MRSFFQLATPGVLALGLAALVHVGSGWMASQVDPPVETAHVAIPGI